MKMNTPICDFIRKYNESGAMRLHMPGHKGSSMLGAECFDITEIKGADSLYEASGIIAESEKNVSELFGCTTCYSTEGSSQCIRAMLYLASVYAREKGRMPKIAAGRNAHKTFIYSAALLDFDSVWIDGEDEESYLSCRITPKCIERIFEKANDITAVYLTSPDYLGNMTELDEIAKLCHKHEALLLVDNAHGAYLRFLPDSLHPSDHGADLCCSSAHKTLPVLTGGAYLHCRNKDLGIDTGKIKNALALFGSSSPSYLILQSLDYGNKYLSEGYRERLARFARCVRSAKERLEKAGFELCGNEPMKITVKPKNFGYRGYEIADELRTCGIETEFADADHLVLMLTPEIGEDGLMRACEALLSVEKRAEILEKSPLRFTAEAVMSIREAMMRPSECIDVAESCGRILASPSVGCPPAVPIVMCGERIDRGSIEAFRYYGIEKIFVIK